MYILYYLFMLPLIRFNHSSLKFHIFSSFTPNLLMSKICSYKPTRSAKVRRILISSLLILISYISPTELNPILTEIWLAGFLVKSWQHIFNYYEYKLIINVHLSVVSTRKLANTVVIVTLTAVYESQWKFTLFILSCDFVDQNVSLQKQSKFEQSEFPDNIFTRVYMDIFLFETIRRTYVISCL